ncbi:MAG: S24/S26 family peptidase [Sulfurovum sp.]|uniref:S24/S26 family peptidase n=1 Tax=Sulfurovum sp. TaxID=1969726 RepID=UPI00286825ED|nr:S24/S26 family peptidase [Sulfurovum sp.]MCO4844470.1 S24/S26 family peptidase [Sulfurovum sp.]
MLQLFKISGDSLYPYYKDGQRVICRKVFKNTSIKVDDTVVFEKDAYGMMIKRVKSIDKYSYFVEGTNPMSIDSRNFGGLKLNEIKYKVLFKF